MSSMGKEATPCGIGPDRLFVPMLMYLSEGVLLKRYGGIFPLSSFHARENLSRLLRFCRRRGGIYPERVLVPR